MKKIFIGFICVFALSLFFTHKSYAIDDLSRTFSAGSSVSGYSAIFPTCNDSTCLSQYSYLIISSSSPLTSFVTFTLYGTSQFTYSYQSSYSVLNIYGSPTGLQFSHNGSRTFSSDTTFTLSDNLPVSQPCPEPEPQEPCPDPEENSRFIQVVLDAFWKYHMVFAGAVAGLIAIFVVYRIIKGMLR